MASLREVIPPTRRVVQSAHEADWNILGKRIRAWQKRSAAAMTEIEPLNFGPIAASSPERTEGDLDSLQVRRWPTPDAAHLLPEAHMILEQACNPWCASGLFCGTFDEETTLVLLLDSNGRCFVPNYDSILDECRFALQGQQVDSTLVHVMMFFPLEAAGAARRVAAEHFDGNPGVVRGIHRAFDELLAAHRAKRRRLEQALRPELEAGAGAGGGAQPDEAGTPPPPPPEGEQRGGGGSEVAGSVIDLTSEEEEAAPAPAAAFPASRPSASPPRRSSTDVLPASSSARAGPAAASSSSSSSSSERGEPRSPQPAPASSSPAPGPSARRRSPSPPQESEEEPDAGPSAAAAAAAAAAQNGGALGEGAAGPGRGADPFEFDEPEATPPPARQLTVRARLPGAPGARATGAAGTPCEQRRRGDGAPRAKRGRRGPAGAAFGSAQRRASFDEGFSSEQPPAGRSVREEEEGEATAAPAMDVDEPVAQQQAPESVGAGGDGRAAEREQQPWRAAAAAPATVPPDVIDLEEGAEEEEEEKGRGPPPRPRRPRPAPSRAGAVQQQQPPQEQPAADVSDGESEASEDVDAPPRPGRRRRPPAPYEPRYAPVAPSTADVDDEDGWRHGGGAEEEEGEDGGWDEGAMDGEEAGPEGEGAGAGEEEAPAPAPAAGTSSSRSGERPAPAPAAVAAIPSGRLAARMAREALVGRLQGRPCLEYGPPDDVPPCPACTNRAGRRRRAAAGQREGGRQCEAVGRRALRYNSALGRFCGAFAEMPLERVDFCVHEDGASYHSDPSRSASEPGEDGEEEEGQQPQRAPFLAGGGGGGGAAAVAAQSAGEEEEQEGEAKAGVAGAEAADGKSRQSAICLEEEDDDGPAAGARPGSPDAPTAIIDAEEEEEERYEEEELGGEEGQEERHEEEGGSLPSIPHSFGSLDPGAFDDEAGAPVPVPAPAPASGGDGAGPSSPPEPADGAGPRPAGRKGAARPLGKRFEGLPPREGRTPRAARVEAAARISRLAEKPPDTGGSGPPSRGAEEGGPRRPQKAKKGKKAPRRRQGEADTDEKEGETAEEKEEDAGGDAEEEEEDWGEEVAAEGEAFATAREAAREAARLRAKRAPPRHGFDFSSWPNEEEERSYSRQHTRAEEAGRERELGRARRYFPALRYRLEKGKGEGVVAVGDVVPTYCDAASGDELNYGVVREITVTRRTRRRPKEGAAEGGKDEEVVLVKLQWFHSLKGLAHHLSKRDEDGALLAEQAEGAARFRAFLARLDDALQAVGADYDANELHFDSRCDLKLREARRYVLFDRFHRDPPAVALLRTRAGEDPEAARRALAGRGRPYCRYAVTPAKLEFRIPDGAREIGEVRRPGAGRRAGDPPLFDDAFCGAGGASLGLSSAGMAPGLSIDSSADAVSSYRRNLERAWQVRREETRCPSFAAVRGTVEEVAEHFRRLAAASASSPDLEPRGVNLAGLPKEGPLLFFASLPCQAFSAANTTGKNRVADLGRGRARGDGSDEEGGEEEEEEGDEGEGEEEEASPADKPASLLRLIRDTVDLAVLRGAPFFLFEEVPRFLINTNQNELSVFYLALIHLLHRHGFQTRTGLFLASHYGAPQNRWRCFVAGARFDCELPPRPAESHYWPWRQESRPMQLNLKAFELGEILPDFDDLERRKAYLPPAVTARDAISDLLAVDYGTPEGTFQEEMRRGQSAGTTFPELHLGEEDRQGDEDAVEKKRKAVAAPDRPFLTITTSKGCVRHWAEGNRPLTLRERLRGFGVPDWATLVGRLSKIHFRLVGNMVCPAVTQAFGRAILSAAGFEPEEADAPAGPGTPAAGPSSRGRGQI
eukprot:tig00000655_g2890.t1